MRAPPDSRKAALGGAANGEHKHRQVQSRQTIPAPPDTCWYRPRRHVHPALIREGR
jgi:hypothetical protein